MYINQFHNLKTLNLKPGKECESLHQWWSHCSLAPGTWVQAEEGLPGPSLQRTPRNIQRCRWVWDLKKPPTVDCTLGSLQTTLHFLKQRSRLYLHSHVTWGHQNQFCCLSPKGGPVNFFLKALLSAHCSSLFLCFWSVSALFQQNKESSKIIPNVLKCLLEICHSDEK